MSKVLQICNFYARFDGMNFRSGSADLAQVSTRAALQSLLEKLL